MSLHIIANLDNFKVFYISNILNINIYAQLYNFILIYP